MSTPVAVPLSVSEMGMSEVERAQALARRYHADFVDLKNFKISHDLFKSVPVDLMFRYNFVPLEQLEGRLNEVRAADRGCVLERLSNDLRRIHDARFE